MNKVGKLNIFVASIVLSCSAMASGLNNFEWSGITQKSSRDVGGDDFNKNKELVLKNTPKDVPQEKSSVVRESPSPRQNLEDVSSSIIDLLMRFAPFVFLLFVCALAFNILTGGSR